METVTLRIDGREVTVEKGRTVLQAAIEQGVQVPYYCYHPGLGVDGSCRVCVVKIEKMPKLQTACSTLAADGMVVETRTPEVVEARTSVFEFLLINHPLDCPVCDKGGECPLQDFSYTFGPNQSRMQFERRVFDGEGVRADVDFGPTLMLNRNRCILCTRCVRFMQDIDGDAQISIIDRGGGSEIATFQEEGVHSLLSGNLMDVCPVGAITTRDYRFKARPWDNPDVVDTICTTCAKGCNTSVWLKGKPEWAKGSQIVRVTPRFNSDVNGYWMCDLGRFGYHWIEGDGRLRTPMARTTEDGPRPVAWVAATVQLCADLTGDSADGTASAGILVSGHASLEELSLVRRLAERLGLAPDRIAVTWSRSAKAQPANTVFPIPEIDDPNLAGARDLGFDVPAAPGLPDLSRLQQGVRDGRVTALFVVAPGPPGSLGDTAWIVDARRSGALARLAVLAPVESDLTRAADLVLPGATSTEKPASYVNEQGRVQLSAPVLAPPGDAREDWTILAQVLAGLDAGAEGLTLEGLREAIAANQTARPAYAELARAARQPAVARHWLQSSNPSERWKWDVLFQDLPPVKGASPVPAPEPKAPVIPLKPVD